MNTFPLFRAMPGTWFSVSQCGSINVSLTTKKTLNGQQYHYLQVTDEGSKASNYELSEFTQSGQYLLSGGSEISFLIIKAENCAKNTFSGLEYFFLGAWGSSYC